MSGKSLKTALESILDRYISIAATEPWSTTSKAKLLFEDAEQAIRDVVGSLDNPYLTVVSSFGKGNWAKVPWIAVFDRRETTTAQKGVYVVLLFRSDMSGVYVTFNQGVTEPKERFGNQGARTWLRNNAAQLRRFCAVLSDRGFKFSEDIDLRVDQGLGKDYEASTVAHKLYLKGSVPPDEELQRDIMACLQAYQTYLESNIRAEAWSTTVGMRNVCDAFAEALWASNVSFGSNHHSLVRTFIASLATKRFVILTGLSGSGKTQIALRFGDWLGGGESAYIVPVRPDWTGSEALFGYEDALQPPASDGRRSWHVPEPLRFMLRAAANPSGPFLLILDEMNLAHVERYFADMLSGMESDYPCLPNLRQERGCWLLPTEGDRWIPVPRNLFVVGTVNVDETTYMFSPKVLDRANTIEFRVSADDLRHDARKPRPCQPADPALVQAFMAVATDPDWHLQHPAPDLATFTEHLRVLHRLLSPAGFEFGHRVYTEAVRFACILYACGEEDMMRALDLQVMQKILPRLHGSRRRLEEPLLSLARFCYNPESFDNRSAPEKSFDPEHLDAQEARLPISFAKIQRMLRILRSNQFVSFAE